MTYSKDNLRQIFQKSFDSNEWQQMLRHYFLATELKAEPERIDGTTDDEQGYYLGAIDTTDSYRIGLFYYQIQHGNVARKRVGLRNLVKSFVNPNWGEFDAALVVFDSGELWRLSFVCDIKGESTAPKRYTYVFGETDNYYNTPVGRFDALQRNGISFENIKDAFSVERLNKDFFNGYKGYYVKFLDYIKDDTKDNRDYVKKLLGRLVFLQFLQKKGWMGVPADNQGWNGGDKSYLNTLISRYEGNDRLLSDVLEPLFFNTLNEPRENDIADSRLGENIKIPYLNGGLFDKDELDKKDIDFPFSYFKELMDFFAMYNFTIDENDPEDSEIGIDPEMLGHIFENLLEDNKDKGTFYTPKEIVQYMSQESVAQYLKSKTAEELHDAITALIKQRIVEPILQKKENARLVNKALSDVKVCDPAIGSGAFPMGVLNVLFDCRHLLYGFIGVNEVFSYAKVKRDIIQNNIYGVDIEKGAVDIARLRFWLALVVDENEPQPLPNLDFKIMQGNSLLEQYGDIDLSRLSDAKWSMKIVQPQADLFGHIDDPQLKMTFSSETHTQDLQKKITRYFSINDHEEKARLFQDIEEDVKQNILYNIDMRQQQAERIVEELKTYPSLNKTQAKEKAEKEEAIIHYKEMMEDVQTMSFPNNKFFLWHTYFKDVFDKGGFDIVIGNPPYFVYEGNNKDELPLLRKQKELKIAFGGKLNAYKIFLASSLNKLVKVNGLNSFIFQNSFMADLQAVNLRKHVLNNCQILTIDSFPERDNKKKRVFESVKMSVCILLVRNANINKSFVVNIWDDKDKSTGTITHFTKDEISEIDPISLTIPRLREEAKPIVLKMIKQRAITIKCCEGELNVTSHRPFFSDDPSMPVIMKGAGIQKYYYTFDMSQGQIEHLKEKEYQRRCGNSEKAHHHEAERIVMQGMTGANDKIRLVMAIVPKGMYLGHSCKYILPSEDISLKCLLGFMNSKLANFFFRCFSTNSNVNGYEIEAIPICSIPHNIVTQIETNVTVIMSAKEKNHLANTLKVESAIDLLVYHLYGLTYDEVLIVDPETPITREEYENNSINN